LKKQLFILVIFSFSCIATQGQSANEIDTLEVFKASKKVPKRFSKDSKILANRLCKDFNDDARKVMAISFWISQNIRYDYRAFLSRTYLSTSSRHTLKNRSALCGGYAQLFKEMCQAVGVKCEVVHGYTKDFDFFPDDDFYRAEHAWTLVKIDGEWNAIDLTWASSQIVRRRQWLAKFFYKLFKWDYDTKYKAKRIFNSDWLYVPAEEFIYSHLPISDAFQMLSSPVSIEDFQLGDSAIYEHITTTSCVQEESPELEAFNSISDFDQWHYLANKSHDFNQLNYRDPAFYLTLVADSLHRKFGEEDPKILKGSVKDLDSLYALCNKIDTLIFKASEGYVREYYTYENRSNRWLMKTKEKNKSIRFRMSERSKLNSKQVKLVKKTAYKNKSHSRYASSISRKKKKNLLVKIDRATEATSEDSLTNLLYGLSYRERMAYYSIRISS